MSVDNETALYDQAIAFLRTAVGDNYAEFRPQQWEAINAVLSGKRRVLLVQRTGWGKSYVYFVLTRMLRDRQLGPVVLLSPLLALMRDQIAAAERLGIVAETINSTNTEHWEEVSGRLLAGQIDILLVSPERLGNDEFRQRVLLPLSPRISMLVVDEAHCISDWGHDFRPDYRRIRALLRTLPRTVPVVATTATANARVRQDLTEQIGEDAVELRGPLVRESLAISRIVIRSNAERLAWLVRNVPKFSGSGIIYTLTVRDAQKVAQYLKSKSIDVESYTGQDDASVRAELERGLQQNKYKALVATSALGMGYDKPDLGFVVHYQRPQSVIHYYQQIGRAGRRLDRAQAILLSGREDDRIAHYFIENAVPPRSVVAEIAAAIRRSDGGMTVSQLEAEVNARRSVISHALKLLVTEEPPAVIKERSKYQATAEFGDIDWERVDRLSSLRFGELAEMQEYLSTDLCLMEYLQQKLDDDSPQPCGRCQNCAPSENIYEMPEESEIAAADLFLRQQLYSIEPRRRKPADLLPEVSAKTTIPASHQFEEGRCLSHWNDGAWGTDVAEAKHTVGSLPAELVARAVEVIQRDWRPDPSPQAIVPIPSQSSPRLVKEFAESIANAMKLPLVAAVEITGAKEPQKAMQNSDRQARNAVNGFRLKRAEVSKLAGKTILLVDDIVGSRWTMAIITMLLVQVGTGQVFPFAATSSAAAG